MPAAASTETAKRHAVAANTNGPSVYYCLTVEPSPSSRPVFVLYICIPAYNEAPTVGLLLWRLRSVMQEFAREYEILVYNDGSTDGTAETLKSYTEVLPLTVLGGPRHQGYGLALDSLARAVAKRTRYPRRDGMLTMQADFTDRPEDLPELIKRFEGGADIVVAEREVTDSWPAPARM